MIVEEMIATTDSSSPVKVDLQLEAVRLWLATVKAKENYISLIGKRAAIYREISYAYRQAASHSTNNQRAEDFKRKELKTLREAQRLEENVRSYLRPAVFPSVETQVHSNKKRHIDEEALVEKEPRSVKNPKSKKSKMTDSNSSNAETHQYTVPSSENVLENEKIATQEKSLVLPLTTFLDELLETPIPPQRRAQETLSKTFMFFGNVITLPIKQQIPAANQTATPPFDLSISRNPK